jgi:hypothetical protein
MVGGENSLTNSLMGEDVESDNGSVSNVNMRYKQIAVLYLYYYISSFGQA